jgi:hypothetical protein
MTRATEVNDRGLIYEEYTVRAMRRMTGSAVPLLYGLMCQFPFLRFSLWNGGLFLLCKGLQLSQLIRGIRVTLSAKSHHPAAQ